MELQVSAKPALKTTIVQTVRLSYVLKVLSSSLGWTARNEPGVFEDPIRILQAIVEVQAGSLLVAATVSIAESQEDLAVPGQKLAAALIVIGGGVDLRGGRVVRRRGVDAGASGRREHCGG